MGAITAMEAKGSTGTVIRKSVKSDRMIFNTCNKDYFGSALGGGGGDSGTAVGTIEEPNEVTERRADGTSKNLQSSYNQQTGPE